MMLGAAMMFGRMMLGAAMMFGRMVLRGTMMFSSTMVFRAPVMLGSCMVLRSFMMLRCSVLVPVMLRGTVFGGSMFLPFMFGLMRRLRQRCFARVAFVLSEFLGVVMQRVMLMSALFLG